MPKRIEVSRLEASVISIVQWVILQLLEKKKQVFGTQITIKGVEPKELKNVVSLDPKKEYKAFEVELYFAIDGDELPPGREGSVPERPSIKGELLFSNEGTGGNGWHPVCFFLGIEHHPAIKKYKSAYYQRSISPQIMKMDYIADTPQSNEWHVMGADFREFFEKYSHNSVWGKSALHD